MGGKTAAAIIINHESQSPFFFIISSPLLKLEGILTKLTMFIEYFCFRALVKRTTGRTHHWVNDNEPRLCQMLYHLGLTPRIFNPLQCYVNSAATETFPDLTK